MQNKDLLAKKAEEEHEATLKFEAMIDSNQMKS